MTNRYTFKGKVSFGPEKGKWKTGFYTWCESNSFINVHEHVLVEEETNSWENHLVPYNVDPETVCQCTGLTGRNDKLIFEGDIIIAQGFECEIVWNEHFLCFAPLELHKRDSMEARQFQSRLCDLYKYKVVGSTHEQ